MSPESQHTYTLVAYRPDAVDACRGQVYARSSSELEIHCFRSEADLVEGWAQLRMKSRQAAQAPEVAEVEFTLLIDGLDNDSWWELRAAADDIEPPYGELDKAADARFSELVHEQARAAQAKQRALEAAQRRKARRAAVAFAKAERARYLALHAQYGAKPL